MALRKLKLVPLKLTEDNWQLQFTIGNKRTLPNISDSVVRSWAKTIQKWNRMPTALETEKPLMVNTYLFWLIIRRKSF